jgi:hypothetical protein
MAIKIFWSLKGLQASVIISKKNNPYFPFWATENFWSPSDGVGVLDDNQNYLVTI